MVTVSLVESPHIVEAKSGLGEEGKMRVYEHFFGRGYF